MINKGRMIDKFIRYVKIDSETKNEMDFMNHLIKEITELGYTAETDSAGESCESNGNNIHVKIPGVGEPLMLSAHMDTVKPGIGIKPIIDGNIIKSDGTTILGADDKSGIAIIIEAITQIKEQNLETRPLEILFTIYEEGGLNGAKNADYSKISAKNGLVFDTGGDLTNIVVSAIAHNRLYVKIIGKPSHAGGSPEKGINALTVASHAITKMNLGRIDEETTCNIGIVNGGLATNIVMPELDLTCEIRSLDQNKLKAQTDHMIETFTKECERFGATIETVLVNEYNEFKTAPDSTFVKDIIKTLDNMDIESDSTFTCGGSDANIYATEGIDCVVIPTGMYGAHTLEEHLKIDEFVQTAEFLINFITK